MYFLLFILQAFYCISPLYEQYLKDLMYLYLYEENPEQLNKEHTFYVDKISFYTIYLDDNGVQELFVFEELDKWEEANGHLKGIEELMAIVKNINENNETVALELFNKLKAELLISVQLNTDLGTTMDKTTIEAIIAQKKLAIEALSTDKIIKTPTP
ncbi:hypothetical protein H311_03454 [Anncaliia algerae PRA109]|nr:hypothetical protein H311_03454 [Anncaliia algerae PRA109]